MTITIRELNELLNKIVELKEEEEDTEVGEKEGVDRVVVEQEEADDAVVALSMALIPATIP